MALGCYFPISGQERGHSAAQQSPSHLLEGESEAGAVWIGGALNSH